MANGKRELIEDISDIRRLAGLAEAPKKAATPEVPGSFGIGKIKGTDSQSQGGQLVNPDSGKVNWGDPDNKADFFRADKMQQAQPPAAAPPKPAAPKPAAPKPAAPKPNLSKVTPGSPADNIRQQYQGPGQGAGAFNDDGTIAGPPAAAPATRGITAQPSEPKSSPSTPATRGITAQPSEPKSSPSTPGFKPVQTPDDYKSPLVTNPRAGTANTGRNPLPPVNPVNPMDQYSKPAPVKPTPDIGNRYDMAAPGSEPAPVKPTPDIGNRYDMPAPGSEPAPAKPNPFGSSPKGTFQHPVYKLPGNIPNSSFTNEPIPDSDKLSPGPQSYFKPTSDEVDRKMASALGGSNSSWAPKSMQLTSSKNNSIFPHEVIKELYDLANLGEEEEDNSPIPFTYTPSPGLPKTAMTGEKDTNPFSKPGAGSRMEKESVEEDNMDDQGLPHKDEWEYDREGDMAKDQLHTIVRHAEELEHALGNTENLPEWVQEKMAQIKGMMMGVTDYMMTQHERGAEQRTGEEGIHGDDMEEGNEFSGALAKAKAAHQDEFEVGGKTYNVKEAQERTMSRAAKGYQKYGKEGMQALAKAGKEGKDLDKIRDKYNKYDNVDEARKVNPHNDSLALMKKLAGI